MTLPVLQPMLATAGRLPPKGIEGSWAFEMKWDGVRVLTYVENGAVHLMSRLGRDITAGYPELWGLASALPPRAAILDGELVAFDDVGRPSFERLQQRMHVRDPLRVRRLVRTCPVKYLLFDLLHCDQRALRTASYDIRREALEELDLSGDSWMVPPAFVGDGAAALATSRQQRLEGVVAKRRRSAYLPGRRSPDWIKVKHERTQDVVICGWRPGEGNRSGTLGSLLCGVWRDGRLVYAGRVGSGFSQRGLVEMLARLEPLVSADSPFQEPLPRADARTAQWVRPELVGEVSFTEWTADGRLRHPVWRGLRTDVEPSSVAREP